MEKNKASNGDGSVRSARLVLSEEVMAWFGDRAVRRAPLVPYGRSGPASPPNGGGVTRSPGGDAFGNPTLGG
ncbi:MAG: hypothetical protein ABW032_08745, partial [Burkholderiaceae bacterium]